jgi:hypothetical protein
MWVLGSITSTAKERKGSKKGEREERRKKGRYKSFFHEKEKSTALMGKSET